MTYLVTKGYAFHNEFSNLNVKIRFYGTWYFLWYIHCSTTIFQGHELETPYMIDSSENCDCYRFGGPITQKYQNHWH